MTTRPSGTVTFLFTDIEGSTRRWEQHRAAMKEALARHDTLLRRAIEAQGGYVFRLEGDAFRAAFATAPGVNLSFDHNSGGASIEKISCSSFDLLAIFSDFAARH